MDSENLFLSGLIELQYGQKVESKLKKLSTQVLWAKDWPKNKTSFWNAEAFMWGHKIEKEKRALIEKELSFLRGGTNLDLGCGSYSYLYSVGLDISPKMLDFNDNLSRKVVGDVERKLPFRNSEFDSVTAIFVLNYVKNYSLLLKEIARVLKPQGPFVAVLYSKELNDWQRQKEVHHFPAKGWKNILEKAGFKVKSSTKDNIWFFTCQKLY
ncbi:MAG: class I SAM-dependent methyltransferase [Candidatus Woesearchaeota archaeon]